MGPNGLFKEGAPALRFWKGRVAVYIPEYASDEDAPLEVAVECRAGIKAAGRLPDSGIPGIGAPAFVLLDGVSPLDGFSILIDGTIVMRCPRTDALYFSADGRQMVLPDGQTTMIRRIGSGPEVADPVSVEPYGDAEVVRFTAEPHQRGFEISRPSVRFRDGASYLYVARYVGAPGDWFQVSISGDFGDFVLGTMPSKPSEGKQVASGTEFRISDYGITVLDWFDVLIDGRKVFSFPQRDVLYFSERGTVTGFPVNRVTAVFLDDVVIESDGECLTEYSLPSGILYRLYEGEGPITFHSSIPVDVPIFETVAGEPEEIREPAGSEDDTSETPYIPAPEVWEEPPEPETDPYPEVSPGSFVRLTPRMVLRETGILRRVCILVPEYRPFTETPMLTAVQNGQRIEIGPVPTGRWATRETYVDIQSRGIDPLGTFSMELEGMAFFSNVGTNALFFSSEGSRLTKPRGRIVAVHRPDLRLGVRGPAKCKIISSEIRGGLVFDEAELGARGNLYNMNVEHRARFPSIAKYGPRSRVSHWNGVRERRRRQSEGTDMIEDKIITQLSIFVNNEPGRLATISRIIKETGIKVRAFNLAESAEFGILRAIVVDPDNSYDRLKENGIIVRKTDIIAISVQDAPDSFFIAADILGKADINIEYGYFYAGASGSTLFVRVDDTPKAVGILEKAGIRLLDDGEI